LRQAWLARLSRKAVASLDAIAEIRHVLAGTWKKRGQRKPNLDDEYAPGNSPTECPHHAIFLHQAALVGSTDQRMLIVLLLP
jgi:hypothetical protein